MRSMGGRRDSGDAKTIISQNTSFSDILTNIFYVHVHTLNEQNTYLAMLL